MIKNIIFDLDETLLETDRAFENLFKDFNERFLKLEDSKDFMDHLYKLIRDRLKIFKDRDFMEYGINNLDIFFEDDFQRHVGKDLGKEFKKRVLVDGLRDFNREFEDPVIEQMLRYFADHWLDFFKPIDGSEKVLEKLSSYRLFLLTDGFRKVQLMRAKKTGLDRYFNRLYASEDFFMSKLYSKPFTRLLEENHILPEETIMVGDNYNSDYLGARKAGIKPVLFDRKNRDLDVLKIRELRELFDLIK